jgi:hypothetical protein
MLSDDRDKLKPDIRLREIATILARGILRLTHCAGLQVHETENDSAATQLSRGRHRTGT